MRILLVTPYFKDSFAGKISMGSAVMAARQFSRRHEILVITTGRPKREEKGMCPEVRGKRTAPSTSSSEYHIRRQPPRVREPRSDVGSRRCVVVESGQRR